MDEIKKEIEEIQEELNQEKEKQKRKSLIRFFIFLVITLITTTLAGAEWSTQTYVIFREPFNMTWETFLVGLEFSLPFLFILTCHEFGHYFTARYYKIDVSLPLYLPFWLGFMGSPSIGTFGAFIRIREKIKSRLEYFDVGIAGPLAGFFVALFVLYYGFTHLPPAEHIYDIHPEYEVFGSNYAEFIYDNDTFLLKEDLAKYRPELAQYYPDTVMFNQDNPSIKLGSNLIFDYFKHNVAPSPELVPNDFEIMHYPWLFAGYLALFFTALNLLPIGQLDGGHILYGLVGRKAHGIVAAIIFYILLLYSGLGWMNPANSIIVDLFGLHPVFHYLVYFYILYYCLYSLHQERKSRFMYALIIFSVQYFSWLYFSNIEGYGGWMLFAFLIGRFLGVKHPPVEQDQPLSLQRQMLGWLALLIFIGSFSPTPFVLE